MRSILIVALGIFAFPGAASSCASAATTELCQSLSRIAADQPNGFSSFQGERIMDNMLLSTASVPGATSCTIAPADKTLTCDLPVAKGESVEARTKAFAKRLAACFPGSSMAADQGMFGPRYLIETESVDFLVNGDLEKKTIGMTVEPKQ